MLLFSSENLSKIANKTDHFNMGHKIDMYSCRRAGDSTYNWETPDQFERLIGMPEFGMIKSLY